MNVDIIAGARPNFIKIAPIIKVIKQKQLLGFNIKYRLIHTGQHYDKNMSDSFFEQLSIPKPDINLEAGGGTQAEQTANIMIRYEKYLLKESTDLTLVVGDVTSTMACSIVAKKMGIPVAHVEGGIRSNDMSMPEEINRIVTDSISDYFFTTSEYANKNLIKNGVDISRIHFVGNTMIDTLFTNKHRFIEPLIYSQLKLNEKKYFVITLHRPANVDEGQKLKELIDEIVINTRGLPIIFPVHPRTLKSLQDIGIKADTLHLVEPLSYLEFNYLVQKSKAVITDSGGITEETTVMGVPCITLRNSTERPETVSLGTNELIGIEPKAIKPILDLLFNGNWKKGKIPEKWDGKTSERIVEKILEIYNLKKV